MLFGKILIASLYFCNYKTSETNTADKMQITNYLKVVDKTRQTLNYDKRNTNMHARNNDDVGPTREQRFQF